MKVIPLVIISTIASLAILGTVHAKSHNPEKRIERMTEKLSLSDTQQNHLRAYIDEKQALRAERRSKHKERKANQQKGQIQGPFAEVLKNDTISVNEVNQLIDEMYAQKREKRQSVLSSFVTFYNSLSLEQREKAKPMLKKMLLHSMGKRHKQRMKKFRMQDS